MSPPPEAKTRVVVTGASGRMGGAVLRALGGGASGCAVVGGSDRAGSPAVGQELAPGVRVAASLEGALDAAGGADVVIDFSHPDATAQHARVCGPRGVALVVGTTGLLEAEKAALAEAAKVVPVVFAPNMSVGVNVLFKYAGLLARALGEDYDVEVLEAHHRMKKDAPSGTALRLGDILKEARGATARLQHGRHGITGERRRDEIGMAVLRGGDVVGDHTVFFLGEGERIELTHRATSRDQFARGAVRAARWVAGRKPGLYDMQDVLGLREA